MKTSLSRIRNSVSDFQALLGIGTRKSNFRHLDLRHFRPLTSDKRLWHQDQVPTVSECRRFRHRCRTPCSAYVYICLKEIWRLTKRKCMMYVEIRKCVWIVIGYWKLWKLWALLVLFSHVITLLDEKKQGKSHDARETAVQKVVHVKKTHVYSAINLIHYSKLTTSVYIVFW